MTPSALLPPPIQVSPIPFELDFKSSTWQNRPSRIYLRLKDDSIDLSGLEELDSGSRFLVLSEQNAPPKLHLSSKQMGKIPSFHYQGTPVSLLFTVNVIKFPFRSHVFACVLTLTHTFLLQM